ncbi:antitoxin (DNA-binding transcriptional repressor) of toxin-antitoxin stability system [Rhizobium rosettiformans]|uniref:Prevent-host-death family protein n=2 Tax=Rhizobium rosettiformans TaxID=1368430 RepID=A0A4S8PFH7_9HYPH|nr:prevent-host-death family protein [Rhizobium rosettiformans]MBB5278760.1 antitoxin (DNA-binding transcriptional repressor) of toxin-antitoxin stability system [Rhizobium rosettiformans]THV29188.1 prevent-host-death family protein [Rhizobium rosettiformans W3]
MRILVDVTEAAARLEELIELAFPGDEIVICRDERPVGLLTPIARKIASFEGFLALAEEGRKNVPPGTTFGHSDFCDEHGLHK